MFKIGDKVKILYSENHAPSSTIGEQGVIVLIDNGAHCVAFESMHAYVHNWWYTEEEMELVS